MANVVDWRVRTPRFTPLSLRTISMLLQTSSTGNRTPDLRNKRYSSVDGSRWLESSEAGASPYGPWLRRLVMAGVG
jgi:hypothetical protein